MIPTAIKLCALQAPTEALAAHAAGRTAFGLLSGLTHRAEDRVTPDQARAILAALPPGAETVLVTHLTAPKPIAALATAIGVRSVQAHGDLPPEGLRRLRALLPGHRLIKAVHVDAAAEAVLARARPTLPLADAILPDSRTADRLGGTGRTRASPVSRAVAAALAPLPVILAGGPAPENVAAAIAPQSSHYARPAGVDVNSGVEDPAHRRQGPGPHAPLHRRRPRRPRRLRPPRAAAPRPPAPASPAGRAPPRAPYQRGAYQPPGTVR